jgi:hypothetical protein
MSDTEIIYETEVSSEVWEDLKEKIQKIDPVPPSRQSYSKKDINRKALELLAFMLEERFKEVEADIDRAERKIQDLRNVVE